MMVTSKQAYKKYGAPSPKNRWMVVWDVPANLELGVIPKRIFCNKDLIKPLSAALQNLITRGFVKELKTWDGCFNIRRKRFGLTMSLHSWGIAVDVNAAWNCFGCKPRLSPGFVKCFTDAGFEWGGTWRRRDGMHFQLAKI
jgi:hypothetical protein